MTDAVLCGCDCGESFTPKTKAHKYIDEIHRERHYVTVRAERQRAKPKSKFKTTVVVRRATEEQRRLNVENIDRKIGAVLCGDLLPIIAPPGAKKVKVVI